MVTSVLILLTYFISHAECGSESQLLPISCLMDLRDDIWSSPPTLKQLEGVDIPVAADSLNYGRVLISDTHGYKGPDGRIRLLGTYVKHNELNHGAKMMLFRAIPLESYLYCFKKLVKVVNLSISTMTYLTFRSIVFGIHSEIEPDAGNSTYAMIVFTTGDDKAHKSDEQPISARVETNVIRNYKGCLRNVRTSTNFVPTLLPDRVAKEMGYSTTLWLDNRYIAELSFANVFFVINDEEDGSLVLNTPPQSSIVFDESLRGLILEIARVKKIRVEENLMSIMELKNLVTQGIIAEMFASELNGRIVPVTKILYLTEEINIPTLQQENPLYVMFQEEARNYCFVQNDDEEDNDDCWTL